MKDHMEVMKQKDLINSILIFSLVAFHLCDGKNLKNSYEIKDGQKTSLWMKKPYSYYVHRPKTGRLWQ